MCGPVLIGGSPVQQPGFVPDNYTYQPAPSVPAANARPRAAVGQARSNQPAANPGTVRLQRGEDAVAATTVRERPPIALPAPEELGLGSKRAEVDWSGVRRRLDALSVATFHLQKVAGGVRFTCVVAKGGERRKFEAEAQTDADAIDAALRQAGLASR